MPEDKLPPENLPKVPPAVIVTVNEETQKASFAENLKLYKRKVLIGFLLVLILVGTSFAVYKLGQKQLYPEPVEGPTPTPVIATPIPEPTADWKTYVNNLNNYSIEYPSNKLSRLICPGEELTLIPRGGIGDMGDQDPIEMSSCARGGRYIIEILTLQKPAEYPKPDKYTFATEKEVTVGGIKGKRYIVTEFVPPPMGPSILWYTEIFVSHNNKTYNIFLGSDDEEIVDIFYQILSTFKFLDTSFNIENWKVYKNDEFKYSIKYPQDWLLSGRGNLIEITNKNRIDLNSYDNPEFFIFNIQILDEKDHDPLSHRSQNQKTNININGQIANKDVVVSRDEGQKMILASFIKDKKYYAFYLRPADSIFVDYFDLILSTFKFLEEETEGEKVFCKDPRPEFCTMEVIHNPPYICGSNGKSYNNICGACADPEVKWYVIQQGTCGSE